VDKRGSNGGAVVGGRGGAALTAMLSKVGCGKKKKGPVAKVCTSNLHELRLYANCACWRLYSTCRVCLRVLA
jgi:hypothetical protein